MGGLTNDFNTPKIPDPADKMSMRPQEEPIPKMTTKSPGLVKTDPLPDQQTPNVNTTQNADQNQSTQSQAPQNLQHPATPFYLSELGYLFEDGSGRKINNSDNSNTIDNRIPSSMSGYTVIFKGKTVNNSRQIVDYLSKKVNVAEASNPYAYLIKAFANKNAMKFKPSDFAYLTKLGVYGINRLWVLRRFAEHTTIPDNLDDWGRKTPPTPVSTLVGWMEHEDSEIFSVNFSEVWTTTDKMLHTALLDIVKNEFGIKLGDSVPIPGFSRGILFAFLGEMGITDKTEYGLNNIPVGDPNVLRVGATRMVTPDDPFGLKSDIKVTLKTAYEMKFIGDVDPGSAMLDIIGNIIYMGTSNTKFVMANKGDVLAAVEKAVNSPSSSKAWWDLICTLIKMFLKAVVNLFNSAMESLGLTGGDSNNQNANAHSSTASTANGTATSVAGASQGSMIADPKNKGKLVENPDFLDNLAGGILQTVLASTVAIYKWPLKGSIALMTGQNSTPWHLTLGNPMSPFVSLGNIVVDNVKIGFENEFHYNDMPSKINVEITVKLGRPIGAQEIEKMFNNSYKRVYSARTNNFIQRKNT